MKVKVIAFDLDDTLWDVDPVIHRAEKKLNGWFKAEVPDLAYDSRAMRDFQDEVLTQHPNIGHSPTEFRWRLIELAMLKSGISATEATALTEEAMEVFLTARNEITFYDGALEIITHLVGKYRVGALTNGNADIHRLGLGGHFSFAFSAEDVGARKPAPDIFHAALEHTGCLPEEMIYVGDDPVNDVDAANQVGLHTIWFKNKKVGPGKTVPDVTIDRLPDLPAAIDQIEGQS